MTTAVAEKMDDLQWPRQLNKVITKKWTKLKSTLVMKDIVDYLIQKRVVTLDYWMGLKAKPISESERTEDFLSLVIKFDQQKFNYFMEALLSIDRQDLVKDLVKAQSVKSVKAKDLDNEKRQGITKKVSVPIERSQKLIDEENKKDGKVEQTDADQMPNEETGVSGGGDNTQIERSRNTTSSGSAPSQAYNQTKPSALKQPVKKPTAAVDNLHKGIGNGEKIEPAERTKTPQPSSQPKKIVEFKEKQKTEEFKEDKEKMHEIETENKTSRPDTSKSREEVLQEREIELKTFETELTKKELELKEQEKNLKEKENEINGQASQPQIPDSEALSLHDQLQKLHLDSNKDTHTTTTSSDILADVREQLKAMKKVKEEIESEHTTYCSTPKEEFARLQDFQNVQHNLDELKEEIETDRQHRENLQHKVEGLKHEVESLQDKLREMETEKEKRSASVDREINRLKTELKNAKANYNAGINSIKMEMKTKNDEMGELKENLEKANNHSTQLEKRVKILETDKHKYEIELQRYEKEVSDLRKYLEDKEHELNDLRNALEETETEKDELVDELADLKAEVSKLKADKKKLETDKKTLLARCVKPNWNQNASGSVSLTTRRPTFR